MAKRGTSTENAKIYEAKKAAGVPHWRIADELGISEITLIRKLRHQLQPDQEAEVLEAIRRAELKAKAERSAERKAELENNGWTTGGTNNG